MYTQIYTFLRNERSKPGDADEQFIKQETMRMIGGDSKLMNVVFNLDVIVFQELISEE